jgi:hypothetical protein
LRSKLRSEPTSPSLFMRRLHHVPRSHAPAGRTQRTTRHEQR